jgi:arylformamidase
MGYDKDYCNLQYNARAMVPDHARFIERWTAGSRTARLAEPCFLDIPWGEEPGQTLDMFPARRPRHGGAPLLVFLHGGYWRSLDKSDFSDIAPAFTHAGAAVAVINYRLVPRVTLEDLVRDVLSAVTWCYLHTGQYGADPQHLYVAGHSAGGHLTAMMLACEWPRWHGALPPNVVKGGLAISGLYDLEPIMNASFLNDDLKLDPERVAHLSPAWMKPATHAPLMTAVGGAESDEFARQNRLIAEKWKSVFQRDVPMPGHHHFSICDSLADATSPLHRAALELLGLQARPA